MAFRYSLGVRALSFWFFFRNPWLRLRCKPELQVTLVTSWTCARLRCWMLMMVMLVLNTLREYDEHDSSVILQLLMVMAAMTI